MLTGRTTANVFATIGARLAVVVLLVFSNAFFVRAHGVDANADARVRVTFPFDSAELRSDYMSNENSLISLRQILDATDSDINVEIVAYSSPEGNENYNKDLSDRRAASVKSYILSLFPDVKPTIRVVSGSEAWNQFRSYIVSDKSLDASSRSELLLIVDSDCSADEKEVMIKADSNYKRLYTKYFRSLRYADISLRIKNSAVLGAFDADSRLARPVVFFPTGNTKIVPSYMGNKTNLEEMVAFFRENPSAADDYVIVGAASPEGSVELNNRISLTRASVMANYIAERVPEVKGKLRIKSAGEDWAGLRAAVLDEDSLTDAQKQELCEIMESDASADAKEVALKKHPAYKTVREKCYPALRRQSLAPADSSAIAPVPAAVEPQAPVQQDTTTSEVDTLPRIPRLASISTKAVCQGEDSIAEFKPAEEAADTLGDVKKFFVEERNMIAAVKTNLLADAITAVNLEVELPVWERVSLMWEVTTPWWETGNKYAFQLMEMGAEVRYWFKPWEQIGTDKLRGFFVGPYVMSGIYDFQFDKSLNYQTPHVGKNVEEGFWSAGLTAGFSLPVGKEKKMNLEFSLSAGYLRAPYQHYYPADDYSKLYKDLAVGARGNKIYFGPTKAKISLVIPITIPTGRQKEVSYE